MHLPAGIHKLDIALLTIINAHRTPLVDIILLTITNSVTSISIVIPVLLIVYGLYRKEKRILNRGICMAMAYSLSSIIVTILKHAVDRLRPFDAYPYIQQLSGGGSPSFPSGHTADAFVAAVALGLLFPKRQVIVPVIIWAIAVAYSRIYLGVHYPTDVLGGMLVGSLSAIIVFKLFARNNWIKH
jgi:undecaprenyl-diphosphatase